MAILLFGFLVGLRHALEADHLAAVATLSDRGTGVGASAARGAAWGLGHTITLMVAGGVCLLLGVAIPQTLERVFEAGVGVMLVVLGFEVLRRLRRQRVHVHVHEHGDGTVHLHAHAHEPHESHEAHERSDHDHAHGPARALTIGLVHGLAGSAALVVLAVEAVGTPWAGIAYIGLFGLGSIVGMTLLSTVIALPLRGTALAGALNGMEGTVGAATIALGVWILARYAFGG